MDLYFTNEVEHCKAVRAANFFFFLCLPAGALRCTRPQNIFNKTETEQKPEQDNQKIKERAYLCFFFCLYIPLLVKIFV